MKQQNLEVVDLGLPSGTLWAKCNIGAENEWESGKYFMWGDIVGRTADEVKEKSCNWHNAPFNGGSRRFNVDYFKKHKHEFVNSNGILLPKHDAAFMSTHGLMRMPTKEQFAELRTNTIVTWEENFNGSGVDGRKFTSKKDSSKYIFIPAVGYAYLESMNDVGSYSFVWSSSLCPSYPRNVWFLYFNSNYVSMGVLNVTCFYGQTVRGIKIK